MTQLLKSRGPWAEATEAVNAYPTDLREATNKLSQIPDGGPILPQALQNVKSGSWGKQGEATQHTDSHLRMSDTSRKVDEEMGANAERREAVSTIQVAETSATMEATKRLVIFKRCPAPTVVYTGRDDENTKVIACITGGKDERRVCVVYGLGGVGKTQLALNVVERTWDEWDHILYVDAGSTEALEKSLKEFAEVKGLGKSYKDAINWLESCGKRWLVVFDNADTPSTNLQQYIPVRGRGGSVLITTRLPDLARLAVGPESVYCLSSMSPADGIALLVKIASSRNQGLSDKDTEAAEELVKEFGYLALAIVHAGAFIAHSPGMTIPKYRSLFTSQRQRMLEEYKQLPEMAKLDERGDTVYTTWKMCYDQLKPESRELLWLIAYLHYYGISEEIFKRAAQNMHSKTYPLPPTDTETQARDRVQKYLSHFMDSGNNWDTVKFVGVMADLTSYSLIEFDRMNLTYRVHVLVHDWAKTTVPHSPELAVECTATVLSLSIDREEDAESLAFKRQLGLHVASVLIQNPDLGANHGCYFTEVYSCTGQWVQKAKLEQKLQAVFQQELGDDHFQTWSVVHRFASACRGLGQWEKALDLQTQVVDAYKELLGEEDPDTLTSMSDLALTYSHLGQYDNAQQLQVQVLDIRKRMLGEEHPHTLTSMGNLALTYVRLGRYDEAEQLEAQVLDIRKHVLGEEHPDTLTSISHLASACLCLGRYDKAEKLETQVLDTRKRVLGEEHPQTLASMGNLASVYVCLGRYHEAEQLEAQVFDMRKHVLGEEHPDTLISMSNLASTYSNLGQYDSAEQLEARVLDIRKRMLGEEHLDTLTSMSDLASIHLRLGRYENAQQLEAWVLDRRKRVLGEEHPSTLTSMRNLASTYSHLGQYDSAQQLQVQILDVSKRMLGKEHLDTLASMKDLASTYSHLGRYNDAEQLQVQVLDIRKRILGEKHPNTLVSMSDLASTYTGLGRYGDAEQLQVQVLDMRKHVLGEEHPHTLLSMNNLASTFSDLGRYNDAEQLQVQVIEMYKRTLGEEHPSTLASMNNLATTYSSLGQWDEAKELFNHAISLAERTLGSQHPRTQLYHDNLESMQTQRNTEMKKTV
ncbi:unnamed protein product [Rhizoctonia solani]|uniref:NB-ARC domain-containing protein n=1 Tax=Rhizoctonia solani TaxID=456999 RepID=A0A8H3E905_9AGAM|nr:unnamed protein product [Rhizoctonia solani]